MRISPRSGRLISTCSARRDNVSFDKQCFAGKLTLSAQLSASKAGQEYTVWYFADGEVQNAVATVDANGVITVENFIVDIA